jgi:hypothetical protein
MKIRLFSAAVLISALPVFAQGPGGPGPMPHGGPMEHGSGFGFGMRQPVTNAPYSATFTSTSTEKLQDGTVLTHTTTRVASRDSLGRTREEITMPAHGTETTPHTAIIILDPVTHTITRLEADKKIAIVHQIPAPRPHDGHRGPGPDGQAPPPPPSGDQAAATPGRHENKNVVVADLGSKSISGVVATGKKTTHTVPAGSMGNTAPIVSTHEEWFSPDLKIELSRNDVDPFHGTHTTSVTSLTKAEPAATLFVVPTGYTVQAAPERAGRFGRGGGAPPPPPPGM